MSYNKHVSSEFSINSGAFQSSELPIIETSQTPERFSLSGRPLYLTADPELVKKQLAGEDIGQITNDMLQAGITTDEIIPNRICLQYTGNEQGYLGNNLLTGLRGKSVEAGDIKEGNFDAIVAGPSFGRGSSRYHAPIALAEAGVRVVIAESDERIFQENCVNAGIYTLSPENPIAQRLLRGESVDMEDMTSNLSPVQRDVMKAGSLVKYFEGLENGYYSYPQPQNEARPMTMVEKIIAQKAHVGNAEVGVDFVKPGEEFILQPDTYYGYELQTTVVRAALLSEYGDDIPVRKAEKILLFNDHTALIQPTNPAAEAVKVQRDEQAAFAHRYHLINFVNNQQGAPAICHTKMLEDHALPGQLVLGNDSHTCTVGAINTLAIGKGAADLAGAIAFDKMVVKVPETIRINLRGSLQNGATMKDFLLQFGAMEELKPAGGLIGQERVFEYGGEALDSIVFDEQIKLTNMAVELMGFTGILEPNSQMIAYLAEKRGMTIDEISSMMVRSDANAEYAHVFDFDLSDIEPTVATPNDTQNGRPLSEIESQHIKIQKAYIGSCTHGTPEDLRQAAEVLEGKTISPDVKLYVQASSITNQNIAEIRGYIKILLDAGAELLPIGCGACMNAGPGSTEEGEVGIFATNRNYPGRTGRGETYLANPAVTAASAVRGEICGPEALN